MTEKSTSELSVGTRKEVLTHEIKSLELLIARRRLWLEQPLNKRKGTYPAVANDTREMEAELENLRGQLEEITN